MWDTVWRMVAPHIVGSMVRHTTLYKEVSNGKIQKTTYFYSALSWVYVLLVCLSFCLDGTPQKVYKEAPNEKFRKPTIVELKNIKNDVFKKLKNSNMAPKTKI